ncbi:MAG: class I adenylate-forming enzyme family protein, partial [Planctomycetota bacterium]
LESLQNSFPQSEIFCVYGISECAPRVCCLDPDMLLSKMGSVGKPLPATTISVRETNGQQVETGEFGEVFVESRCLMKGYYNDDDATQRVMTEYGFRTGDVGYLDEDGYLFLSGRLDSVFKSGGEKVSCRLIEETIRSHPDFSDWFSDIAVLAGEDHYLGQVPFVYYVSKPGAEGIRQLRQDLKTKLPASHLPSRYLPVADLPRSPSGKLKLAELKAVTNRIG